MALLFKVWSVDQQGQHCLELARNAELTPVSGPSHLHFDPVPRWLIKLWEVLTYSF